MSSPGSFRLTFLLPADFRVSYAGPQPAPNGCLLRVVKNLVEVTGPSQRSVFDDASVMLRAIGSMLQHPSLAIAALLESPPPTSGRDGWQIIVMGGDVAFSPTSLDPYFPAAAE